MSKYYTVKPRGQSITTLIVGILCLLHGLFTCLLLQVLMPATSATKWLHLLFVVVLIGIEIAAIRATLTWGTLHISENGLEIQADSGTTDLASLGNNESALIFVVLFFPFFFLSPSRAVSIPWKDIESVSFSQWLCFKSISIKLRAEKSNKLKHYPIPVALFDSPDYQAAIRELSPEENPLRQLLDTRTAKN